MTIMKKVNMNFHTKVADNIYNFFCYLTEAYIIITSKLKGPNLCCSHLYSPRGSFLPIVISNFIIFLDISSCKDQKFGCFSERNEFNYCIRVLPVIICELAYSCCLGCINTRRKNMYNDLECNTHVQYSTLKDIWDAVQVRQYNNHKDKKCLVSSGYTFKWYT